MLGYTRKELSKLFILYLIIELFVFFCMAALLNVWSRTDRLVLLASSFGMHYFLGLTIFYLSVPDK